MKRENILITEDCTTKRVAVTKFRAPGDIPALDSSIHFGTEGDNVVVQNCFLEDNRIAKCSPEDNYDFETGALIALMKMCGVDKVVRACNEAFSEDTFKTYATIYERELNEFKKENDSLKEEIKHLKEKLDCEKLQHGYTDSVDNLGNALKQMSKALNEDICTGHYCITCDNFSTLNGESYCCSCVDPVRVIPAISFARDITPKDFGFDEEKYE
jgi:hypothetical protein